MAPMSNAERQKKYRERLKQTNPIKYEDMRNKHLQRIKLKKIKINEQNQLQQEKTRAKWREYSDRYYKKKKNNKILNESRTTNTSMVSKECVKSWKLKIINFQNKLRQCEDKLKKTLTKQETMRKQIYRLKQIIFNERNKSRHVTIDRDQSIPSEFNILSESISSIYKQSSPTEKTVIKKIVNSPITKKYRMVTKLGHTIGIKSRIRIKKNFSTQRKSLIQQIHNFYLRNDISRATAGKKECKTKEKTKMQIRFLTDTILNLYRTYKKEGGKASYSTLVRYRPFYVLSPKLHNRETCACIRHANIGFKITKLYKLGILKTNKIEDILKDIACNLSCKECMYGNCHVCAMKKVEIKKNPDDKTVCWLQWCMKTVPYKKINEEGEEVETFSKRFSKEVISDQFGSLLQKFQQEVTLFKKHYFNMMHQHKLFRECVDNIKKNEIVIVVDFSENYQCKYNLEIQSMHYASSRTQITLHTGVAYVKNEDAAGFCSISPNNEHTPHSIWAHLLPVLNSIKYQHPEIDTLHVHSDGPTTQYRQKKNFALFDVITKQLGYKYATWSYFEAAHGKNAADGIGGVLKRTLDRHVAYGKDISNAVEAFMLLKEETNISLYYVSDKDIKVIKETYAVFDLYPLIGTMSLHQIITTNKPGVIKYRHVSCFCGDERGNCSCFNIKLHTLYKEVTPNITTSTPRISKTVKDTDRKKNTKEEGNQAHNISKRPKYSERKSNKKYKQGSPGKENKSPHKRNTESDNSLYVNEKNNSVSSDIKKTQKVTILSDIKLHPDNQRYYDFSSPGPSSFHIIDPTHDICLFNNNSNSSDNDSNLDIF